MKNGAKNHRTASIFLSVLPEFSNHKYDINYQNVLSALWSYEMRRKWYLKKHYRSFDVPSFTIFSIFFIIFAFNLPKASRRTGVIFEWPSINPVKRAPQLTVAMYIPRFWTLDEQWKMPDAVPQVEVLNTPLLTSFFVIAYVAIGNMIWLSQITSATIKTSGVFQSSLKSP